MGKLPLVDAIVAANQANLDRNKKPAEYARTLPIYHWVANEVATCRFNTALFEVAPFAVALFIVPLIVVALLVVALNVGVFERIGMS